jgi:hypothetical protein
MKKPRFYGQNKLFS